MIIVKLMGGLGNQMFQYAAGKALAVKHGVPLLVDTSFLEANPNGAYTKRTLELSVFSLPLELARPEDLAVFRTQQNKWKRLLRRMIPAFYKSIYFAERGHGLQKEYFTLPAHTYLEGFWQNEVYFSKVRQQLLQDFQPKEPIPADVEGYYARIKNGPAVSLHVRRGDYVSVAAAGEFHGLAGLDYYSAALTLLKEKVGDFELSIFSDDIAWCKSNITHRSAITYIEHSGHAVWDMMLMRECQHHIIANSSFSWWGAWLNAKPNKIVIMPKQWFQHLSAEEAGIKPDAWVCL